MGSRDAIWNEVGVCFRVLNDHVRLIVRSHVFFITVNASRQYQIGIIWSDGQSVFRYKYVANGCLRNGKDGVRLPSQAMYGFGFSAFIFVCFGRAPLVLSLSPEFSPFS